MRAGLIKIIAEKRGISIVKLSNIVGVSEQQLHRLVKTGSTKVETIEKIAAALNVSPKVFFDENFNANNLDQVNEPVMNYFAKNKALEICEIEKKALQDQLSELKRLLLK